MTEGAVSEGPTREARGDDVAPDRMIAIVLLSIEPAQAASVLRQLSEPQLTRVTRAMKELQDAPVSRDQVDQALERWQQRAKTSRSPLGDVAHSVDQMLHDAFGERQGAEIAGRAAADLLARRPFAAFEAIDPADLASLLADEHPQITALFLAHLDAARAGRVLRHLPEVRRPDLVRRVATLGRTSPEVLGRLLEVLQQKIDAMGLAGARCEPASRIKTAAQILNHLGGGERRILDFIAEEDDATAREIREELFTFADLAKLDRRSMQKVLSQVESRVLALALRSVPQDVEDNVFDNLSKRAADMVREERDTLGPTPLSEVLEAQQQILELIRGLMDVGDLSVVDHEILV